MSRRSLWSASEDRQLFQAVCDHGEENWEAIVAFLPGRTEKDCRDRWLKHVNPTAKKSGWTQEEDELITALVQKHGTKWSVISQSLPGRTHHAVKNRYSTLVRHQLAPEATSDTPGSPYSSVPGNELAVDHDAVTTPTANTSSQSSGRAVRSPDPHPHVHKRRRLEHLAASISSDTPNPTEMPARAISPNSSGSLPSTSSLQLFAPPMSSSSSTSSPVVFSPLNVDTSQRWEYERTVTHIGFRDFVNSLATPCPPPSAMAMASPSPRSLPIPTPNRLPGFPPPHHQAPSPTQSRMVSDTFTTSSPSPPHSVSPHHTRPFQTTESEFSNTPSDTTPATNSLISCYNPSTNVQQHHSSDTSPTQQQALSSTTPKSAHSPPDQVGCQLPSWDNLLRQLPRRNHGEGL